MFKIIAIICILIIVYLFYSKVSSVKEYFIYGEGDSKYEDMNDKFTPSSFNSKNEMLKYLQEYYIDAESMVIFEHNNKKCAFYNTPATDKVFSRYIVPQNMTNVEGVPYENVNTEIYTNDRHVNDTDDNMKTVLNFHFEKEKDINISLSKSDIEKLSESKLNYETLQYYNSKRVPSQYIENYVICGKSDSYDKKKIESLKDDNNDNNNNNNNDNIDDYFQSAFQCSGLACGELDTPDEILINKAFQFAHEQVKKKNKDAVNDILYSKSFLSWILKLKNSHDTLNPTNRIK